MKQTTLISAKDIKKNWYIVDAEGQTVGRLSTQVALLLRGKHKVTFTPHINNGDHVIVINAEKAIFTGKKETDKNYYHHSMHPGGLRRRNVATQRELDATKILERAIRLMLPKNVQGANQFRALHVIKGSEHPYAAQKPEVYVVNTRKGENK
ncbi:50S ribosomal protein L13 [Williamsoniiplasma lucivorax]|uniref:Large ribosomal subunit protein uL13 n=1 Tax=Williamsoniiplasma lucivorax TaxID=209274 RepID=A0A2S5RFQ1_9MOLU|nr:50S ribosomal protein L13 [Williamsoniiplasma lucivorax]PPE06117.1 50S ribosomal protein L13 [Williamsoniiplasma lucivorax]